MAPLRRLRSFTLVTALLVVARTGLAEGPTAGLVAPPTRSHLPVRLSVSERSSRDDLTLYVQRGVAPLLGAAGQSRAPLEPLCHAPCAFDAPFGLRAYGVSAGGRPLQLLDRELALQPGDQLALRYRSRAWLRWSGWLVLFGGVGASSALISLGSTRDSTSLTVTGGVLSGVFVALGLIMANSPDRVSAELAPR